MLAADRIFYTQNGINYYRKPMGSKQSLSKQVSYAHARGALNSLLLVKRHLLSRENSERIKKVMADYFANFIYLYSGYKDLGKEAESQIFDLGFKKIPPAGGANFRRISGLIGFHNALWVKNFNSYIRNIT
jgi:hypothetical protein